MFNRHRGQETVKGGTYINYKTGEMVSFGKEGGLLPGGNDTRYINMPLLLMMGFGPLLGLLFILFLPAVGAAVVAMYVVRAITGGLTQMKGEAIRTAAPTAVGVSFLQGAGKTDEGDAIKKLEEKADEVEGLILELEEEIRNKRTRDEK